MDNKESSVLQDLWNSIGYCIDSIRGKYSLDTYLQIVSVYTDGIIKDLESNGFGYRGGECRVKRKNNSEMLEFKIEMYFQNEDGRGVEKKAERQLAIKKFTRETILAIGNQELRFKIDEPKENS